MGRVRFAVTGVALSLSGAYAARRWKRVRSRLFELEVDAETAAVRDRLRQAVARSERHALVNAVTAVEGAAVILRRETLTPSDRESLGRVLDSGMISLRRLASGGKDPGAGRVSLAGLAATLAEEPAWQGRIRLDVPPDLVATGSSDQTVEAVRRLLSYVSRRGSTGPVTLRGERDADWVVLWVEGRAAARPRRRRPAAADLNGHRGSGPDDVTLHVALRLVKGQGGELRIDGLRGGGRSFGVCLPSAGAG
jgi:hypothetical protein